MASVLCTNCGAKLTLKSAVAPGKKINCPKCKKPFVVEDEEEPEEEATADESSDEDENPPPAKKRKATKKNEDEEDDASSDDEDDKPRKKKKKKSKKKSSAGLIIGIVAAALFLVCGVGGALTAVFWSDLTGGRKPNVAKAGKDLVDKGGLAGVDKGGLDGVDKGGVVGLDKGGKGIVEPPAPKADLVISAEDSIKEWGANPQAAKDKLGKFSRIEVTGVANGISKRDMFYLKGAKLKADAKFDTPVAFIVKPESVDRALRTARGQKVKVNGTFNPKSPFAPTFLDAVILLDGPEMLLRTVTAESLVKEYLSDEAGTKKKYTGDALIVTGAIAELRGGLPGNWTARLKGSATIFVDVQLGADQQKFAELREGQNVELRGDLFMLFKDKNAIQLTNGYVVSAK
jgi:phage FluMu protein Com